MVSQDQEIEKNLQQSDNVISFEDKMTSAQRNKARRKKDRSLERGRFARKASAPIRQTPLTATGRTCDKMSKYVIEPLLGTQQAHIQFFARDTFEPF